MHVCFVVSDCRQRFDDKRQGVHVDDFSRTVPGRMDFALVITFTSFWDTQEDKGKKDFGRFSLNDSHCLCSYVIN